MAPISIAPHISDVTHLMLESYLASTTGIEDWLDFDSGLGIHDDSALSYRGAIWCSRFDPLPGAKRSLTKGKTLWSIRLLISGDDADVVSVEAHKWARYLSVLLESCATLEGMAREGGTLDGEYLELTVTNATLAIEQNPWLLTIDTNKDGGAVAIVQSTFTVTTTF